MAGARGNAVFWELLCQRRDVDLLCLDFNGNTPLMAAADAGQSDLVATWVKGVANNNGLDISQLLTVQNGAGHNLFMLIIKNLSSGVIERFIDAVDLTVCIDQKDSEGANALLQLCSLEKWGLVKQLLTNTKLDAVAMDVHPTDKLGSSALALVLVARAAAQRQAQNFKVKNDASNERMYNSEAERLWSIVKLLLVKERDLFGMSLTTGRDAGVQCIRQQLECNRKIRPPVPEEVVQEFTKLYNVVFKAKKKPAPPPEVKVQPKKAPQVSSFQQKMNDIYKEANKDERTKILESLKLERTVIKVEKEEKSNFNDLEWDGQDEWAASNENKKNGDIDKVNGTEKHLDKHAAKEESAESNDKDPSVDEIRAMWKRNKTKEREAPKEEFNSSDFFDSLLKKHESNHVEAKPPPQSSEEQELAERMNEEIVWALQQKQEAERLEKEKSAPVSRPTKLSADALKTQQILKVKEEMKKAEEEREARRKAELAAKAEEEKKQALAKAKKKVPNFMDLVDKPKKPSAKLLKAQEEKEIQELENSINEEIRWALEEKKRLEEERNERLGIPKQPVKEKSPEKIVQPKPVEKEKIDPAKKEEERERKLSEERQRLERLQREAEEMIRKAKQQKVTQNAKQPSPSHFSEEVSEELQWAQQEKERVEREAKEKAELKETEEKIRKEEERARKRKEEQEKLERIQREAEELIRKAKEKQENKPKQENTTKILEQEEQTNKGISEEMQWALEEKARAAAEQSKKEANQKLPKVKPPEEAKEEKISPFKLKSVKDRDTNKPLTIREQIEIQKKKEEERLKKLKEEKDKLANLQTAVEQKISEAKANSSEADKKTNGNNSEDKKSINGIEIIGNQAEESSSPANIPKWKRDKMMRDKSKSVEINGSPKSSVGQERKLSEDSPTPSESQDDDISKLPRWKREKILR